MHQVIPWFLYGGTLKAGYAGYAGSVVAIAVAQWSCPCCLPLFIFVVRPLFLSISKQPTFNLHPTHIRSKRNQWYARDDKSDAECQFPNQQKRPAFSSPA